MVVGTGEATCMGCGYEYQPKNGDPEYPITPGTYFSVSGPAILRPNRMLGHAMYAGIDLTVLTPHFALFCYPAQESVASSK